MKPKSSSLRSSIFWLRLSFPTSAASVPGAAMILSLALSSSLSADIVESITQNTAGTTVWVCPPGVTAIEVECRGGGGAGGSAYRWENATGTNHAGGGGGGGGAYAKGTSVAVTPGLTYNLTVPPAAENPFNFGSPISVDGAAVSFSGDSVTITAAGGKGGVSVEQSTNVGISGAGGAGGAALDSSGDVKWSGGNGASRGSNAGGAGGGGAGDTEDGGDAISTSSTGGAGGISGGGNGGSGKTGNGTGNPASNPGGGGGGGRSQTVGVGYAGADGGLGQVTINYTIPTNGNKLVITSTPANAQAGIDFSVTVQAQDSGGSPINVAQDTDIVLSSSGGGALTGNTATILAGNDSVTLTTLQYTMVEAITLTAARTSGDALDPSAASSSITVDVGPAGQLVFTTQPSASTEANTPFATQPVVEIQDAFGNPITSGPDASLNVSLSLTTGSGTLGGTTSLNATAGVADFSGQGLNINFAGSDKVLTAEATGSAGLVFGTTVPFTITATPLTWSSTPATFNWTTAAESNWVGGTGFFVDFASDVTFDDSGDASSPINLDGTLSPTAVTVNTDSNDYVFSGSGSISGTTGLTKSGTSTLTVATANDYSGLTSLRGGTLVMANPSALGTSNVDSPLGSTCTLRISTDGGDSPTNLISHSGTADLINDIWSSDWTIESDVATPGPGINHTLGYLNVALSRINIVAGPNVSGGNPKMTFDSMILSSATAVAPGLLNPTTASLSILGNVTTSNNTAKTLYLGGTSTDNEILGDFIVTAGSVALTKTGSSIWTLSGANNYTGLTTVNEGTLINGSAATFANNGALTVEGTGTLDLGGNDATFTAINAGADTGTITNAGAAAILTGSAQPNVSISSLITGNIELRIANGNASNPAIALGNANTFNGGVTLLDGTGSGTRLRANAAITGTPFGTGPITIGEANTDKASVMLDTASNTIPNDVVFNTALGSDVPGVRVQGPDQVLSGQITANLADATFCSGNTNSGTASLTGKVTGTNGLALTPGSAATTSTLTVTLNNAGMDNDYAGNTTISKVSSSDYTLSLGAADQIPNGASAGNVINDGTLDLGTSSETINGLSGTGIVQANGGTLTVGDNDATSTFDGVLQDNGGSLALIKIGAGTLTLNGVNTHTGGTTVNGGVLAINGGSVLDGTSTLTIDGGKVEPTGIVQVAVLDFGSGPVAVGTWGATGSIAANIDDAHFVGTTGVVNVVPAGYGSWATANVGGQDPSEDFNNDGVDNGIAYFMNDTGIISLPGIVGGAITWVNGGNIPASAYGTEFVVETSQNLVDWTPVDSGDLTTNDDTTLTYTLPTGQGKWFARLTVTPN